MCVEHKTYHVIRSLMVIHNQIPNTYHNEARWTWHDLHSNPALTFDHQVDAADAFYRWYGTRGK